MVERLRNAIRDVEGFPKEGIVFKDITPILGDAGLFRGSIDLLCETAGAAVKLLDGLGAKIVAISFLTELSNLAYGLS